MGHEATGIQTVMISSTTLDLPEHRAQARDACLQQGMFPTMMEHMPASGEDAVQASMAMVDRADLYLLIVGFRYGYVPAGQSRSITEMEYDRAFNRPIPCLVFMMDDSHPVRPADVDRGENAAKVDAFRQRLGTKARNFFKSPQDLRADIINALSQFRTKPAQADLLKSQVTGTRYRVAVINECETSSDAEVKGVTEAVQTQIHRDLAPAWGVDAELTFVPRGAQPPADCWWMIVRDETDSLGALGYRDLTPDGLPRAKVFVKSARDSGCSWTVSLSHVMLEMLVNPTGNLLVYRKLTHGRARSYAREVCNACTADEYGYEINGVLVSDFVYPAWFESFRGPSTTKFDHAGRISAPFQVLEHGYTMFIDADASAGWRTIFGATEEPPARKRSSARKSGTGARRRRG
jgi:hypothetical protein